MKNKKIIALIVFAFIFFSFSVVSFASSSPTTFIFSDTPDLSSFNKKCTQSFTSNNLSFEGMTLSKEGIVFVGDSSKIESEKNITVYTPSGGWIDENYKTIVFPDDMGYLVYGDSFSPLGSWLSNHEHSYTSKVILPTCTDKGYTSYVCECGHSYTDTEVEAIGHSYSATEVIEPSCDDKGYTIFTCSACNHTYKGNYVNALGHTFSNKYCTVCNAPDPNFLVQSKDFSTVIASMLDQMKVTTAVSVISLIVTACISLVFMWWGIRKISRALIDAFKKGKISL